MWWSLHLCVRACNFLLRAVGLAVHAFRVRRRLSSSCRSSRNLPTGSMASVHMRARVVLLFVAQAHVLGAPGFLQRAAAGPRSFCMRLLLSAQPQRIPWPR